MRIIVNIIISIVMRILYHSLFRITVGDKDYNHFPGTIIKIFSIHFASGTLFPEVFSFPPLSNSNTNPFYTENVNHLRKARGQKYGNKEAN